MSISYNAPPPHLQPSINCSLFLLRYRGASYSSPGREPQSLGGRNSLLHPLSFLLLPSSKGGGRRRHRPHTSLMRWCKEFQKTNTKQEEELQLELGNRFYRHLFFKTSHLNRLRCWCTARAPSLPSSHSPHSSCSGDNPQINKFIKNGHIREKQLVAC